MSDNESVGQLLRILRVKAGMGIKVAAPKVGVSYTYLSKVENNVKTPSPGFVTSLCELYESNPDDLIAKLGSVPDDIQEIVKEHGKDAFDLLRNTFSK